MKFRVSPTKKQIPMVILMAIVWISLFLWVIPEIFGVISPEFEDTYSEWVWDLPIWGLLVIVFLHVVAGILLLWSAGHFVEGYVRRRRKEGRES